MSSPRLGFAVRLMMFAAPVFATDWAASRWVVVARSYRTEADTGGPPTRPIINYPELNDGSQLRVVSNRLTGVTVTTVIRPATWQGLCLVWWPAVASGSLTLLAFVIALTRTGQAFIAAIPLPRMTTRQWLIAVAVLGTEGGLIVDTLRSSGVDPLYARWTPIGFDLAVLHILAFMPVVVVLLYRRVIGPGRCDDEVTVTSVV